MIPPPSPQRAVLTLALLASLAPLSLSQPADGCVFDPTKPPCASFELSSSQSIAMLEDLCNDDAGLPACTILRICASDPTLETLTFCSPFSILSAACYSDGSSLRGCRTYTQLCRPASLVRQCAVEGPPKLPSKQDLLKLLTDGCSREWGPECEPCITRNPSEPLPEEVKKTGSLPRTSYPARSALSFAVDPLPRPKRPPPSCEPLTAYSLHCQSYPDLPSCNAWTTFCDSAPVNFLPVCKPIPPPPPPLHRNQSHLQRGCLIYMSGKWNTSYLTGPSRAQSLSFS
ncbi:hypothetical protein BC829DRAFT_129428 [Chytridium lagenaria]|nr:hypothetical protein BC829DRAFT_129428 [Chytridium lagenaria]